MGTIDTIQQGRPSSTAYSGTRHSFYPWMTVTTGTILAWLQQRLAKRRSRIALLELTDEQLKDIGISRADAYREAHRPFWD